SSSIASAGKAGMAKPARHVRRNRRKKSRARPRAWFMAKTLGQRVGDVKDNRTAGQRGKSLALSRLVPAIRLVDDVKAPAAAYHAVVAMALAQGPERILDLHAKHLATVKGIGRCEGHSLARPGRTISRAARP